MERDDSFSYLCENVLSFMQKMTRLRNLLFAKVKLLLTFHENIMKATLVPNFPGRRIWSDNKMILIAFFGNKYKENLYRAWSGPALVFSEHIFNGTGSRGLLFHNFFMLQNRRGPWTTKLSDKRFWFCKLQHFCSTSMYPYSRIHAFIPESA